jgi:uncharacterized membrane protein
MKLIAPLLALAICYALFFGYVITSYGSLPAHVASHFDIEGQPNGWMSRDGLVKFMIGFGIFMPLFVVGMMAVTGRIPVSFVNLPNRDYWLAPERRKATSAVLLHYALWFACMNVLFVTGLHWLIVQSNAPGGKPHLNGIGMALVLGGFLIGTGIWVIFLRRRFSKIT